MPVFTISTKIRTILHRNINYKIIIKIVICLIIAINIYFFICKIKSFERLIEIEHEFKQPKLVWPEQLPYGDRIKAQLNYIPNGYNYEKTPIKRILLYNSIGHDSGIVKLDQGEFIGCPVSQCMITIDGALVSEAEVIMFKHTYVTPKFKRPPNQIWILFQTESPHLTQNNLDYDVFNMTADYRWDSDIPNPYGYFMKYNPPLPRPIERNYAENKKKKVAWFVSNCHPYNDRWNYVMELAKYISVDIYGKCSNRSVDKDNAFKMLKTDYKFYLAFENAHCLYYITEKLFDNSMRNDVLPIVMGPPRSQYELMVPKNAFIHVDDFESPEQLAAYLHEVDKNDTLYNEYFQWKHTGTIAQFLETSFYCRLCAMLHDTERPPKHYENINKWWRGEGVCGVNVVIYEIKIVDKLSSLNIGLRTRGHNMRYLMRI